MKNWLILGCVIGAILAGVQPAGAQVRDNVWNGAVIGGAIGAGAGIAFTHAVRDSDLSAGQYAYGALVFGGIGAGIGMGIDVLLFRNQPRRPEQPPRVVIAPAVWRNVKAVAVKWRW
jgi:hypothetical protein